MVTVKQLRELLATMPDDMLVVVDCNQEGGGYDELDGIVDTIPVYDTVKTGSYYGRFKSPSDLNEDAKKKYKCVDVALIS